MLATRKLSNGTSKKIEVQKQTETPSPQEDQAHDWASELIV